MIPAAHALIYSLQRCQKFQPGDRLGIFSFKKDRGYWLENLDDADGCFSLEVFGFMDQKIRCPYSQLRTVLKPVIAREFPRSNKLHVKFIPAEAQLALAL